MSSSPSGSPRLSGAKFGSVKNLAGFRKGYHRIPNVLPDPSWERQFASICAPELEQRANGLFEKLRDARGYKRREIHLAVDPPSATLTTADFTLDILYAPGPDDPGDFQTVFDLHTIRDIGVFADDGLNNVFDGVFNRVAFPFSELIAVEDVIDEIEEAPGGAASLRYAPDYRECLINLPGFAGEVRITARRLEIINPAAAAPAELVRAFVEASEALSAHPTLARLIPRRQPDTPTKA